MHLNIFGEAISALQGSATETRSIPNLRWFLFCFLLIRETPARSRCESHAIEDDATASAGGKLKPSISAAVLEPRKKIAAWREEVTTPSAQIQRQEEEPQHEGGRGPATTAHLFCSPLIRTRKLSLFNTHKKNLKNKIF